MLAEWREERTTNASAARRSSALHGAAAALIVACTQHARVVWPCHCHGLGLISLRDARERCIARGARRAPNYELRLQSLQRPADAGLSYFKVRFEEGS